MTKSKENTNEHDFIIVGSGAGGGPLAANLALAGFSVLLIEAGTDEINDNYSIPAYHPLSTEDSLYSWEFFVKHYSDDNNPQRDPKHHPQKDEKSLPGFPGIFYPRASGLGGCTTHHAMITVYPHESDWEYIAALVNDDSWKAENMRKYFDDIERPQYGEGSALLKLLNAKEIVEDLRKRFTDRKQGKQKSGWLSVGQADPRLLLRDKKGVLEIVKATFKIAWDQGMKAMPDLNPNHPKVAADNLEGVNLIPISVHKDAKGKPGERCNRIGARERVLQAVKELQQQADKGEKTGKLDIVFNTFATKVVLTEVKPIRAIGVHCIPGEALYGARHHSKLAGAQGEPVVYAAQKEVILCGGAFNTPQLLMLSGIGPEQELREHGIDVVVRSEGVGKNLQDRYEVGVVSKATQPFKIIEEATFKGKSKPEDPDPDPIYTEWFNKGEGVYATNGALIGVIKRSSTRKSTDPPDLYIFGVPGLFRGYELGYAQVATHSKDYFTWAVLKGHTDNRKGEVTLNSADPFERPDINFNYFEEGTQPYADDVQSVVDGLEFVQKINERLKIKGVLTEQVAPGPEEKNLYKFVRDNAWGHHASCTCQIGPVGGEHAVLDKDFQVQGVENLRVVDASIFPRIPGLFILASVYMISEKASEVIIKKYRKNET